MSNKNWYCFHLKPDGTQYTEETTDLRRLFNHLHVSSTKTKEYISSVFAQHHGDPGMLFAYFNDAEVLENPRYPNRFVGVYGVRGVPNAKRASEYATVYFDQNPIGTNFFKNVFGSVYLTKREGSEYDTVLRLLNQKLLQQDEEDQIVASIVERLWNLKEKSDRNCLVIVLDELEIQESSVKLLERVYRLIPQKLRLDCGFTTNCIRQDVQDLRQKLPISVITMRKEEVKGWDITDTDITLFDVSNWKEAGCDENRIKQLLQLMEIGKVNPNLLDAKLAYAEEKIGRISTFQNMQSIVDMVLGQNGKSFWWEDDSIDSVDGMYKAALMDAKIRDSSNLLEETKKVLQKDMERTLSERLAKEPYREQICNGSVSSDALKFFNSYEQVNNLYASIQRGIAVAGTVLMTQVNKLQIEVKDLSGQLGDTKSKLDDSEKKNAHLDTALTAAKGQVVSLIEEKSILEGEKTGLQSNLNQCKQELSQTAKQLKITESKLDEVTTKYVAMKEEVEPLQNELKNANGKIAALNVEVNRLEGIESKYKQSQEVISVKNSKISTLQKNLDDASMIAATVQDPTLIRKMKRDLEMSNRQVSDLQVQNSEMENEYEQLRKKYKSEKNEIVKKLNISHWVSISVLIVAVLLLAATITLGVLFAKSRSSLSEQQANNESLNAVNESLASDVSSLEGANSNLEASLAALQDTEESEGIETEMETEPTVETSEEAIETSGEAVEISSEGDAMVEPVVEQYIMPDSSTRIYTKDEIADWSLDEIRWAINEIYAKKGWNLNNDPEVMQYFADKTWYQDQGLSTSQVKDSFNVYERENINTLAQRRDELKVQQ